MRSLPLLLLTPLLLAGAGVQRYAAGPFEVLSTAGAEAGLQAFNHLEQLRFALGSALGKTDLQTVWPIRVLLLKQTGGSQSAELRWSRDSWSAQTSGIDPGLTASVVSLLLRDNAAALPANLNRGLVQLYATLRVENSRVTLGTPPAQRDRDWSRAHLLSVHPDYSGKLRVLLGNLAKGIEPEVAYRNAFEQSAEEIERRLNTYIEAGQWATVLAPSRPLHPRKETVPVLVDSFAVELARADDAFAQGASTAEAAYRALLTQNAQTPGPLEGLGLIAAGAGRTEQALENLRAALGFESAGARAALALAQLTPEPAAKKELLQRAAKANAKWAEPHVLLAELETDPLRRVAPLQAAAERESANPQRWQALATAQERVSLYVEAGKSWAAAARATDSPAVQGAIREARLNSQRLRLDQDTAAREAERRKAAQELADLKNRALREIREAEARANAGQEPMDPSRPLYEWKGPGDDETQVEGSLIRVDCEESSARLHVRIGPKRVQQFVVPETAGLAISGPGVKTLACGVQKPRKVVLRVRKNASAPDSQVLAITFR